MKAKTDTEYIHQLITEGEHIHQDFKFAITDVRKIAKSLSAFSNTEGGRLLVGVKDNGKIAGISSDEEIYMIEAAATVYCHPPVKPENHLYRVEGKNILEVRIAESQAKPVCALDETGKAWAYVRIDDENILANIVHLNMWKHNKSEEKVIIAYTETEQNLLNLLKHHKELTLNQCSRLLHLSRPQTGKLLADFIRFGLIKAGFRNHIFYYSLT